MEAIPPPGVGSLFQLILKSTGILLMAFQSFPKILNKLLKHGDRKETEKVEDFSKYCGL